MLNHARTLLINKRPSPVQRCSFPGEELLDPTYVPFVWPTYLQSLARDFYGTKPDRWMRNYRTRQIMSLIHTTPLVEYVTRLDPRITYRFNDDPFTDPALYVPKIKRRNAATTDRLRVIGKPAAPDVQGTMYHSYNVDVLSENTVQISLLTPPFSKPVFEFEIGDNGWSAALPLAGSGYSCQINTVNPGANWTVEVVNRPQRDLSAIGASIENTGEPIFIDLFGVTKDEPYLTFKNAWWQCKELPLRMSGLLLAMIYRAEERRLARGTI